MQLGSLEREQAYSFEAEGSIPEFDFEKIVGRKLRYSYQHRRAVFLVVVDITDFDGSFPTAAVDVLADCLDAVEERIDGKGSSMDMNVRDTLVILPKVEFHKEFLK